ncbi:OmpA family protein [Flavobacterium sp. MK4S-17]|uniref:OmpA family protein n=1 Tax=Flavobacterium sp. MK4S-17 TaxID=2543737 RepID=UPI0013587D2A|nr:OmpA family protein [Flavobacterium sp. MK4S-17]
MKKSIFLLTLLCCFSALSQQKLKKADKLFNEYAYMEAARAYEDYLEEDSTPSYRTMQRIADTYYYLNEAEKALKWYDKLKSSEFNEVHFYRYISLLRIAGQYAKADKLMEAYLRKSNSKWLEIYKKQKLHADSLNTTISAYSVYNIDANTSKADFGTAFYGDKIVYSSAGDSIGKKLYSWNGQPFLEMFIADRDTANGNLYNKSRFMPKAQTKFHNATLTFSTDLSTVYFTANRVKRYGGRDDAANGTNNIEIVKGVIKNDGFTEMPRLPFNEINSSNGHPALSADGRWLYFTSDRPGGYGETDIYKVEITGDNTYGKPINLGSEINTPGKEMFPFIMGNTLYFSSNGHYGYGGLDVFESSIEENNNFSIPQNLGKPINSSKDDFSFIINHEKTFGYFSSNRDGGKGDDDIYYFTKQPEKCNYTITGTVRYKKTKLPVVGVTITVKDTIGSEIATALTLPDGTYKITLDCSQDISVAAAKQGHTRQQQEIIIPNNSGETKDVDFWLDSYNDLVVRENGIENVAINPIYFEFDKYNINEQAAAELNKVVYVLENFPDVVIKIESHTDSRGNDDYNRTLSENRAQATYNYILSKDINSQRIESVKGYGESRLINNCGNGADCTEEEHLKNRRSEFIIVRK